MSASPVNFTIEPRPTALPAAIPDAAGSPARPECGGQRDPHCTDLGGRGGAVAGRALLALLRRG